MCFLYFYDFIKQKDSYLSELKFSNYFLIRDSDNTVTTWVFSSSLQKMKTDYCKPEEP